MSARPKTLPRTPKFRQKDAPSPPPAVHGRARPWGTLTCFTSLRRPSGCQKQSFSFRTAGLCPGGVCSRMPLLWCVWGAGCPPKLRFLPPMHGPRRAHEASLNALSCVCGVKSGRPCPSTFRGPLPAMQTCVPCTHMGHGGETPGGGNTDLKLGCFLFAGFFVGCTDPVFPCRSPRARRGPAWEFLDFALCGAFSPPG